MKPSMERGFDKKIFTAGLLLSDLGFLIYNIPNIVSASGNRHITKVFIEKIMTVVSAVNGCVYCSWFHAKRAVDCGISEEEVQNMLRLQFRADATAFELMALLYAQHFAETNRRPSPAMTRELFDCYGESTAGHILLIIRMISFGNLYGNTWDAVISRLKGRPAQNSSLLFEAVYLLLNFSIMVPAMIFMKHRAKAVRLSRTSA